MSAKKKADRKTDGGSPGMTCCASLRMPQRESEKWKELSKCLDTVMREIDYPAIHQGFCRRKVKVLDAALVKIIQAATDAQSIIRHNDKIQP